MRDAIYRKPHNRNMILYAKGRFGRHELELGMRRSHRRCSMKKDILKISQNSQDNNWCQSPFLIKLQASAKFLRPPFFIKQLWYLHFSCQNSLNNCL